MDEQKITSPCLRCERAYELNRPVSCAEMCLDLENFVRIKKAGVHVRPKIFS